SPVVIGQHLLTYLCPQFKQLLSILDRRRERFFDQNMFTRQQSFSRKVYMCIIWCIDHYQLDQIIGKEVLYFVITNNRGVIVLCIDIRSHNISTKLKVMDLIHKWRMEYTSDHFIRQNTFYDRFIIQ